MHHLCFELFPSEFQTWKKSLHDKLEPMELIRSHEIREHFYIRSDDFCSVFKEEPLRF